MLDKNKSLAHECGCGCSECACGQRNRFFRGKRMRAAEFQVEQAYGIDRRRIINRTVLGHGVVTGFEMKTGSSEVGPGFALDADGREIVLAHKARLGPDNLFLVAGDASGCRTLPLDKLDPDKHYVLAVHYAERPFGEAGLPAGCGCDKPEHNFTCETAVFSIRALSGPCPCGDDACDRKCECGVQDSCGRPARVTTPPPPYRGDRDKALEEAVNHLRDKYELPHPAQVGHEVRDRAEVYTSRSRGPHACVCHWLSDGPGDCSRPLSCTWHGYHLDPAAGVDLACVKVRKSDDPCYPVEIVVEDPCGPRHFVKNNELLYDFMRGCDLTHISWVSWHHWHRHEAAMPWKLFSHLFREKDGWTEFVVRFSAPVLRDTIRFDSVEMRAITIEQPTAWRLTRRIPIIKFDFTPHGTVPPNTTDQIRFIVARRWIKDEIEDDGASWLTDRGFELEIEIFGDGILDCHHQPIDGEAVGVEAFPSGNGSPGGTYRSCFRVEPKPHPPENAV